MPNLGVSLDQGLCTSRDPADLAAGEMQTADGLEYLPGNTKQPWKVRGRSLHGATGTGTKVHGIALCQFDDGGIDRLIAHSGDSYYWSDPATVGSMASLVTGLNASADKLSAAHSLDRWYLCNGYDYNRCLKSDGTVRRMGMVAPQEIPVVTLSTPGAAAVRPTSTPTSTGWTDPGNSWDGDSDTVAGATLAAVGTSTLVATFAPATLADYNLYIDWALSGLPFTEGDEPTLPDDGFGIGGSIDAGYNVSIEFSYSVDDGFTWTSLLSRTATSSINSNSLQATVSVTSNIIHVKAVLTYTSGTSTATLRVADIRATTGSSGAAITDTTGRYYAISEYNATDGIESPVSEPSALSTFAGENFASVALPSAAQNTSATHYRVYATPDGGTAPQQLGWLGG